MNNKHFTWNTFYFKKLRLGHRRIIHFALLACIIFLQVMAIVIWYNDNQLSRAFDAMSTSNKVLEYSNLVNNSILQSQEHFNDYINHKDEASLKKYAANLDEIGHWMDSLRLASGGNAAHKKILLDKNKTEADILVVKASIDSIIDRQIGTKLDDDVTRLFKFNKFGFQKILDSVKTETYIKVDSISRDGLIARLGDAITGKYRIQKERLNTIVTMQYKDKVTSGTIEEQLKNVFLMGNRYYENEFNNLKKSFLDLRNKDLRLMVLNNELLKLGQNVVTNYAGSNDLVQSNNKKLVVEQYRSNQAIKEYSLIVLILLMFLVSLVLLGFTRMAFEYEKKLALAQNQIRQSLEFKNRIMGMISHEIRSPLNIMSIYSKKVAATVKDIGLKETFKSIQFTTNSLILLANQILEYSRDENHKPRLKNKNFYLKEEIDQIIFAMTPLLENKGNKLRLVSNLVPDCEVCSDATKIHQLFYNLVGNANKFTENGLISITANIEVVSGFEMNLKVVIEDNGTGIAPDDLKNLFESYYQGTVSGKVNDLGVGLGLNLCKEIVELFEGEIAVQSEGGNGTKVTFNLILGQI